MSFNMRRKKSVNNSGDVCCPFQELQVMVPVTGMAATPKLLEEGTVCQVDSDNVYIGGKFKLNWKKITDFSLAEDSFQAGIEGGLQVSARVDQTTRQSLTWTNFAKLLEKRWDKVQRRRTEKETAAQQMEKPLPVKRAYQPKRSKASHFLSKNMQNIKDWDSDDDLVFNRKRPKDLLEAQKKRRANQQQEQQEQDMQNESDKEEGDPEILSETQPSTPHTTAHLKDQDLAKANTHSEDNDDTDYKDDTKDTKRKTRKLKRKRRIQEVSDDESLFESPNVTTPMTQHIVTPGTTFRKPVLDDNDDDDNSHDETKTSIAKPSKKKIAASITNFFVPLVKEAAPTTQKMKLSGGVTSGKRAVKDTKIEEDNKHDKPASSNQTHGDTCLPNDKKLQPTRSAKNNPQSGSSLRNNFFAPRCPPSTVPKTTYLDTKPTLNVQDDDTVGSTPPDEIPTQYFDDDDSIVEDQELKATSTKSKPMPSSSKRVDEPNEKHDAADDPIENFDEPTSPPDSKSNTINVSPATSRNIGQKRRLFPRKSYYGSKPPTKSTTAARALELAEQQSPHSNLFFGMESATPSAKKQDLTERSPASSISPLVVSPIRPAVKTPVSCPEIQATLKWRGLRNLGNTCYINASLQMLYSIPPFVDSLKPFCRSQRLISTFCQIYDSLNTLNVEGAATARTLKLAIDAKTPKFRGYHQRDAHEFLGDLIDQVHEEIHNKDRDEEKKDDMLPSKPEIAPTDEFFRLNVEVCLQCKSCGYSRTKEEMYRYLSVDIDYEVEKPSNQGKRSNIAASVERCLKHFFQPEDRELKCEKCNHGDVATQTMRILSLPRALVIHLKRFKLVERPVPRDTTSNDGEDRPPAMEITFQKSPAPVELTQALSLKDYLVTNHELQNVISSQYTLRSIVHHIGSTADSGHYTADALRLFLIYNQ